MVQRGEGEGIGNYVLLVPSEDDGHTWSGGICLAERQPVSYPDAALAADGRITLVEVKSGLPDFRSDGKWLEYLEFCDDFYFAVAPGFPTGILPAAADCGVIVADAWDASVLRPAPARPLAAARRRTVTIRIARAAALRLRALTDPRL